MSVRFMLFLLGLMFVGVFLVACGGGATSEIAPTATVDLVATEVAVQKAAVATLTAEAVAAGSTINENPPASDEPVVTDTPVPLPSPTTEQTTGDAVENPPTDIPTPATCTVVANDLNLRSGPDVIFEPPIRVLSTGTVLVPQARNADNTWIEVQVQGTGEVGWVDTGAQFITCNFDVTGLPLGQIPPTPTATSVPPTPAEPAPPTPTPPIFVDVPVDGGQADLEGNIVIPGFTKDELNGPDSDVTFRDRLVFNVKVFVPGEGDYDGAGIEKVKIKIFDPHGEKVHERTENNAAYCVFGGGEPDCDVFYFKDHHNWPEEGQYKIENGQHRAEIDITTKDNQTETWNWRFFIQKN